jgi:hypothetical protein
MLLPVTAAMTDMLRQMLTLQEGTASTSIGELFLDWATTPEVPAVDTRFSPPLFARNPRLGLVNAKTLPASLEDLNAMDGGDSGIISNTDNDDMDEEHVRIVGGWRKMFLFPVIVLYLTSSSQAHSPLIRPSSLALLLSHQRRRNRRSISLSDHQAVLLVELLLARSLVGFARSTVSSFI